METLRQGVTLIARMGIISNYSIETIIKEDYSKIDGYIAEHDTGNLYR